MNIEFQVVLPGFLDLFTAFYFEESPQKALVIYEEQFAQIEMLYIVSAFGEILLNEAIEQRGLAAGLRTVEKQDVLRFGVDPGL